MSYSIDYSVVTTAIGQVPETFEFTGVACFSDLSREKYLSSKLYSLYSKPGVFIRTDGDLKESKVTHVIYKPDNQVSTKKAMLWLETILYDMEFIDVVHNQTPASILKDGIVIDGNKMSGATVLTLLSLIRTINEEPGIINSFYEFLKLEGMDGITAMVMAHSLYINPKTKKVTSLSPQNRNHTAYTGFITMSTLKDSWKLLWKENNKKEVPWNKRRNTEGVHKMLTLKGNSYLVDADNWLYKKLFDNIFVKTCSIDALEIFLNKDIYPARDVIFNNRNK
jgi:hypothetical protein